MNPILQQMKSQNNVIGNVINLCKGNPNAFFSQLMSSNPAFRNFVNTNQGKAPEQIARENGIDYSSILSMMK